MISPSKEDLLQKIEKAIEKAINYLVEHQLASGEFATYMSPDAAMQEWCVPESNTGFTAEIGNCLIPFQDNPLVDKLLTKSTNYLSYQDVRGGIWQFYAKWHPKFKILPPDVDDTALVCNFLRKRNVSYPDNIKTILLNRNKQGLFYTWFTLHSNFFKYSRKYWRLIARELKAPISTFLYWTSATHRRNDIDLVINCNVVSYLGYNDITKPVVKHIIDEMIKNKGKIPDKWYLNEIVHYYFISRLYDLDIPEVWDIKSLFEEKIKNAVNSSKNFQHCDLEIALATTSLLKLNVIDPKIEEYVTLLLSRQALTESGKGMNWLRVGRWFGVARKLQPLIVLRLYICLKLRY
ncbi:prenyltransferase/squalene oxidase repeat-containing protein [Niabella hibiscisoli]|uniref:hypothetical protein n=1 Tax=Niabella hibiscisoli TaxID=1825928 RepID=UPI001F0DE760|nr:hypothetical protein [Niabella hibiscisoli]MCH5718719.1 hypothetical protein [Niabella hibiscisoli]